MSEKSQVHKDFFAALKTVIGEAQANAFEAHATVLGLGGLKIEISGTDPAFKKMITHKKFPDVLDRVSKAMLLDPNCEFDIAEKPNAYYDRIREIYIKMFNLSKRIHAGEAWLVAHWNPEQEIPKGCTQEEYNKYATAFQNFVSDFCAYGHQAARLGGRIDYIKLMDGSEKI